MTPIYCAGYLRHVPDSQSNRWRRLWMIHCLLNMKYFLCAFLLLFTSCSTVIELPSHSLNVWVAVCDVSRNDYNYSCRTTGSSEVGLFFQRKVLFGWDDVDMHCSFVYEHFRISTMSIKYLDIHLSEVTLDDGIEGTSVRIDAFEAGGLFGCSSRRDREQQIVFANRLRARVQENAAKASK